MIISLLGRLPCLNILVFEPNCSENQVAKDAEEHDLAKKVHQQAEFKLEYRFSKLVESIKVRFNLELLRRLLH